MSQMAVINGYVWVLSILECFGLVNSTSQMGGFMISGCVSVHLERSLMYPRLGDVVSCKNRCPLLIRQRTIFPNLCGSSDCGGSAYIYGLK